MIRSRNPRIDVAALESRLAHELQAETKSGTRERLARLAATVHIRTVEMTLERADERSVARREWPTELASTPIFKSQRLRRLALRVLGLILRDQHEVNVQLIRAQRESLALVRHLVERLEDVEQRLEDERAAARSERLARRESDDRPTQA